MNDAQTPQTPQTPDVEPAADPAEPVVEETQPVPELTGPMAEAIRRTQQRFVTAATNQVPPSPEDLRRVHVLIDRVQDLGTAIEYLVPECRDKSLALTHLEDVLTRASRAIYVKDPIGGQRPALADQAGEATE